MPGWRSLQSAFWNSLSTQAFLIFSAAVFVTFASMGFLIDLTSLNRPYSNALYGAFLAGCIAVASLAAFSRTFWFLPIAIVLMVFNFWFMGGPAHRPPFAFMTDVTLPQRLRYDMIGALLCMVFGYTGFVTFIGREGRRWAAVDAEMKLARQIHQTLVPQIDRTIGRFEFHGLSLPSGQVGGDLVDLLPLPDGRWLGYVADVAGHGVSSGLLMGMVKSAVRMRMPAQPEPELPVLVAELNRLICDQSPPAMFVTMAAVCGSGDGRIEFTLAGHPPILRVRKRTAATGAAETAAVEPVVESLAESGILLGVMPDWRYDSVTCQCEPGDVFAIVTDGLFEVFDSKDRDFGLDGIKSVLASAGDLPLPEIADRLMARVSAFGPQLDDQTLLLVRYR